MLNRLYRTEMERLVMSYEVIRNALQREIDRRSMDQSYAKVHASSNNYKLNQSQSSIVPLENVVFPNVLESVHIPKMQTKLLSITPTPPATFSNSETYTDKSVVSSDAAPANRDSSVEGNTTSSQEVVSREEDSSQTLFVSESQPINSQNVFSERNTNPASTSLDVTSSSAPFLAMPPLSSIVHLFSAEEETKV